MREIQNKCASKCLLSELMDGKPMGDITPIINDIRMIKTDEELKIAKTCRRS